MTATAADTTLEAARPRGWAEWLDRHSGPHHGAAGRHRPALLRDLPADHLGLSGAVALRAGAGRLHAQIHRPDEFQKAAHRLAAISSARHVRRLRPAAMGHAWRWSRLALLFLLARYLLRGRATILGTLGRLITAAMALGLALARACRPSRRAACRARSSTRSSTSCVGVAVQFLLGLGLALLCGQPIRGRNFFRVLFFIPLMVTPVGIAYTFRMLADMQKGPFAPLCCAPSASANGRWATEAWSARLMVLVGDTWQWTPFMFIVLLAAIENQPRDQVEAARLDGASGFQIFRDITWPAIAPVAATVVLIRLIEAFKIIDLPNVLTGGGPGLATEFDDAARLHRLAHAGSRRLGRGRLHAALRLDRGLRLVLQLRRPRRRAGLKHERRSAHDHCALARCSSRAALDRQAPVAKVVTYALLLLWALVVLVPLYWVLDHLLQAAGRGRQRAVLHPVRRLRAVAARLGLHARLQNDTLRPYLELGGRRGRQHVHRRPDRLAGGLCAGAHPLPGQARARSRSS